MKASLSRPQGPPDPPKVCFGPPWKYIDPTNFLSTIPLSVITSILFPGSWDIELQVTPAFPQFPPGQQFQLVWGVTGPVFPFTITNNQTDQMTITNNRLGVVIDGVVNQLPPDFGRIWTAYFRLPKFPSS